MKALVLVGGFGTRLRPLTLTTPKQMLPIAGIPMIEWVVGRLAQYGVDEVILSLGYRPDAFIEAYPDQTCAGVAIRYVTEPEPLGTAGAVRYAALEAGLNETFLVLNGDVLTDLDVGSLIDFHRSRGAEATIALHRVEDPSAFGVVPTHDDGRVIAFVEKPPRDEAPTDLINAGTYVVEPSVIDRIPAGRQVSIERETFPQLADAGSLYAMAADPYWLDTGTPQLYIAANLDAIAGRRVGIQVEAVSGTVAPDANVTNSVVGVGSTIGAGAEVTGSVIMSNVIVGEGAIIRDSILMHDVEVGTGATVVDCSVVGIGERVSPNQAVNAERIPLPD
ncbi:MAG: NDP-sugar synthase [Actinobacteria bacterium]|nr:NDP-sugar synthase [Actinomycetota bacterium]